MRPERWSGPTVSVLLPDVVAEEVAAEVVFKVAKYGVVMIRVVLRVGILDHKGRTLNSVVVGFADFGRSCPRELKVFVAVIFNPLTGDGRDFVFVTIEIMSHQKDEQGRC